MTLHPKGLLFLLLFLAALAVAQTPGWGFIAAGCVIFVDWILTFACGWGGWAPSRGRGPGASRS